MKRIVAACGPRELIAMLGLALIASGLALVSIPIAMVTTGALLLALAALPLIGRRKGGG